MIIPRIQRPEKANDEIRNLFIVFMVIVTNNIDIPTWKANFCPMHRAEALNPGLP